MVTDLKKETLIATLKNSNWIYVGDADRLFEIWTKAYANSIIVLEILSTSNTLTGLKVDVADMQGTTIAKIDLETDQLFSYTIDSAGAVFYKAGLPVITIGDTISL